MHFPGAGLLLMVGVFLLAIYFIFGQKTTNNNKFLGFIYRTCFSLTIIGGIFFIMHWPRAGFVRLVSLVSLILGFILLFIHKKQLLQKTSLLLLLFWHAYFNFHYFALRLQPYHSIILFTSKKEKSHST